MKRLPSIERLHELLRYCPETGSFSWLINRSNVRAGSPAGCVRKTGCVRKNRVIIGIDGDLFLAHRIAWAITHGHDPAGFIDHINGNPLDNRIANLRVATNAQNQSNKKSLSNNTSGYKGVSWNSNMQRWRAQVVSNKKNYHLGYFAEKEDAIRAYADAAKHHFGEFARTE